MIPFLTLFTLTSVGITIYALLTGHKRAKVMVIPTIVAVVTLLLAISANNQ